MALAGGQVNAQGEAVLLTQQVDLGAVAAPGIAQRMIRRLLPLRWGRAAQDRHGVGVLFGPGGGTAGPYDGSIDAPQTTPELTMSLQVIQQVGDQTGPGAILTPAAEAVVGRVPRARTRRGIAPA